MLASFFVVYYLMGTVLMVNYAWGVIRLLDEYPHGNQMDPTQDGPTNLWGKIWEKKWLLYIYYFGFVAATSGYLMNFPVLTWMMWKGLIPTDTAKGIIASLFVFFLTELFWMPLSVFYIEGPSDTLWWVINIQLKCSAVSGLSWCYFNWKLPVERATEREQLLGGSQGAASQGGPSATAVRVAQVGSTMFALHCACLDGTIWPGQFYNDGRFPPVAPS